MINTVEDAIRIAALTGKPVTEILKETIEARLPELTDAQALLVLNSLFDALAQKS